MAHLKRELRAAVFNWLSCELSEGIDIVNATVP